MKSSKPATEALSSPGLSELLEAVVAKHSPSGECAEEGNEEEKDSKDADKDGNDDQDVQFTITSRVVKLADVKEDARLVVDAILRDTRAQLQAQIQFISQDQEPEGEMHAMFLKSPMASFVSTVVPARQRCGISRHVSVFFDAKLSGEANSRASATRIAAAAGELRGHDKDGHDPV